MLSQRQGAGQALAARAQAGGRSQTGMLDDDEQDLWEEGGQRSPLESVLVRVTKRTIAQNVSLPLLPTGTTVVAHSVVARAWWSQTSFHALALVLARQRIRSVLPFLRLHPTSPTPRRRFIHFQVAFGLPNRTIFWCLELVGCRHCKAEQTHFFPAVRSGSRRFFGSFQVWSQICRKSLANRWEEMCLFRFVMTAGEQELRKNKKSSR